jgi:putative FmdB family regulatory protein
MPKYEYSCIACDLDYEKERSINDVEPRYTCDTCGYALQRVFTPFGLQFKGSGFYKTSN